MIAGKRRNLNVGVELCFADLSHPSDSVPSHLLISNPTENAKVASYNAYSTTPSSSNATASTSKLPHLVAHEASLIQGHSELAKLLETPASGSTTTTSSSNLGARDGGSGVGVGGRLIKWSGTYFAQRDNDGEQVEQEVWIDRYDALNLLSSLPPSLSNSNREDREGTGPLLDPKGFEDLSDDYEEMFYFVAEERESIDRERKRRRLELGREERIKRLKFEEEDEDDDEDEEEQIEEGKEPSETQLALMTKLHQTLSRSPDPSLLEMRIMANHGKDEKFSFLRKGGKWRDVWERIRKGEDVMKKEVEKQEQEKGGGGLGLGDYGSDSEEEPEPRPKEEKNVKNDSSTSVDQVTPTKVEEDEEDKAKKAQKAERVKEWARKRKEARELEDAQQQQVQP